MSTSTKILAALTLLCLAAAPGARSEPPAGFWPGWPGPTADATPTDLVGSWYAGAGGTVLPYDPTTGTFGRPSGKGLLYVFEPGGRYRKAFQSYASSGGCTNGFRAVEEGTLEVRDGWIMLRSNSGRMVVEDTCAPSLNSDEPLRSLSDEAFLFELRPSEYDPSRTVLFLQRADGASGTFQQL